MGWIAKHKIVFTWDRLVSLKLSSVKSAELSMTLGRLQPPQLNSLTEGEWIS